MLIAQCSKPRLGIFGGSFNPIHMGHIGLAKQILQKEDLDEVWFLISPLNPFKNGSSDLLDDNIRLEIARKALENEPHLVASDYEFRLPKPSYTWNTLKHLKEEYPDKSFVLIIGADNWLAFDRWARPDYILDNFDIAVYAREDSPINKEALPHNVHLVDAGLYPVSSTEIRQKVKEGKSIEGLVPDSIVTLIEHYYH